MRFNKQELAALASQTSQSFDREGVMLIKEKQDGFFRRSEGDYYARWFRLRGNLLFYLKGPGPWQEPVGCIVLGQHQVKEQPLDESGNWPFHLIWENGVCYKLATFHEAERTLWLKAIETAPYTVIVSQIVALKEKLNKIRATTDITTYRLQKGIVLDMNEIPLCELALFCDNLLCDTHGRPPSPVVVIYVKYSKGLCIKYGTTEIVETCSNPCFSKTILFRASDGLSRETIVRIVVYDVKERVSETAVPMGSTTLQLSTIQEAQRLRVALMTRDNKTVGFVTINGWSLEPSYIGTSPSHTNEKNCIDIPQKILCHRRSQSLPPRLGLKLKFPSYGNLLKQNFVNSHQVTYRFHSGLGGDITVHEIMAEPKLCYQIPMQLLEIYIQREKELLEELLSVGDICGHWRVKRLELASTHMSLLQHYCHSKKCLQQAENAYFKASSKKDDSSLEFAPVNLHLQRMWVYNDTLNKTGFHDVITAGAFAAHTHKSERTGGLIRLVQQVKDITNTKAALNFAAANKIQAEYDNVIALRRLRDEILTDMERIIVLLQANQHTEVISITGVIKTKAKSMLALWEPAVVEESLAIIGWPKHIANDGPENQTLSAVMRLTDQLSLFEANSDCENFDTSSSSSSKETSPIVDVATFPSSSFSPVSSNGHQDREPFKNMYETELRFYNDYFKSEERSRLNHSFRSIRSPSKPKLNDAQSLSFDSNRPRHGSLRHDFKSTASLEQVSYRCLMESLSGIDKKKSTALRKESCSLPSIGQIDSITRENNLAFLKSIGTDVDAALVLALEGVMKFVDYNKDLTDDNLEYLKNVSEGFKVSAEVLVRWLRVSHAALRLRCESTSWAWENATLQTRRYMCFSQALATLTSGLLCWFCSAPSEIVVKILTSELGPLCGFEGLLSLYSTEKAMWGDMVVAIEDLQTVVFTLTKVGHSNMAIPQVSGTRDALIVHIPVSDSLYGKFVNKEHLSFTITPVFFNVGINEKATLAEALGETTPQFQSNNDNLDRLYKYYYKYNKVFPADHLAPNRASSRTKPLEEVMENLRIAVHKKVPKNIEVLHLAALATRLMNGIRFTSCKSAKDRTGMSVTLEQCSILASEYHLAEHEMKKALSIMRSEGCRRENTFKNIGVRKYAFTKKQVMALPEEYRPPPGTYGSTQT
ncbi:inositol polyphosphate-4-phosphatase type I A [Maniola jurtina]|uniref:inositol polyphosphate-4-phosphatase type I A n=1 Tax=Maniola jurtina TaxID=191418 RepID=UPI001E68B8B3|nr:inositol polyphosphate-4-phosphatase type I A [Maniola jurtina]XP_045784071.1 inositol polyphosphate-4-phosphatase type I A [Maniola jurtina]